MTKPTFAPERIVAALNADDVAYVLVGGLAVAAHGVVRATRDIDLVPEPSADNLDRLAHTLIRPGAEHPLEGTLTGASLARPLRLRLALEVVRHHPGGVLGHRPALRDAGG